MDTKEKETAQEKVPVHTEQDPTPSPARAASSEERQMFPKRMPPPGEKTGDRMKAKAQRQQVQTTVTGQVPRTAAGRAPLSRQAGPQDAGVRQARSQGTRDPRKAISGLDRDRRSGRKRTQDRRPTQKARPDWSGAFLKLLLVFLFAAIILVGFSLFLRVRFEKKILTIDAAAYEVRDAVLILGCGVYQDGSPTPMLNDRMITGIDAFIKGAGKKLILSGDHGQKNYDEVKTMKEIALSYGIREDDIFLDHAGFSTYDSIKRAKDIFGVDSLCIITQKYHLYRALFLADSLDIEAVGVAADTRAYKGQWLREVREILARAKDSFNAIFEPNAEIMGSPIDLSGDGRVTWD